MQRPYRVVVAEPGSDVQALRAVVIPRTQCDEGFEVVDIELPLTGPVPLLAQGGRPGVRVKVGELAGG